jgi:mannose-6-phosphate isomerase-like protein (cupin superfamily)
MAEDNFSIVHMDQLAPVDCACGQATRAFVDDKDQVASLHVVEITEDARAHYHKRMTEIYFVLEGSGHIELDGVLKKIVPGTAILIKPGCRHRAVGDLKIINVPIPAFDSDDEWFD